MDSLNLEVKKSILKEKKDTTPKKEVKAAIAEPKKQNTAPVRRLYSDVVQGLSPTKAPSRHNEPSSPTSTATSNKDTPVLSPKSTTPTCMSTNGDSAASSPQKSTKTTLTPWKTGGTSTTNTWCNDVTNSQSTSALLSDKTHMNQSHLDSSYHKSNRMFDNCDSLEGCTPLERRYSSIEQPRSNLLLNSTNQDNYFKPVSVEDRPCPIHPNGPPLPDFENGTIVPGILPMPNRISSQKSSQESSTWIQGKHFMFQGRVQGTKSFLEEEKYSFVQKNDEKKCVTQASTVVQQSSITFQKGTVKSEFKQESTEEKTVVSTAIHNDAIMQDGDGFNQRRYSFESTDSKDAWQFKKSTESCSKIAEKSKMVSVKPKASPATTVQKTYPYNTISYSENMGITSFCPYSINNTWNVIWTGANEQEQVIQCNYQAVNHYGTNVYPYQLNNVGVMTNSIQTINYNTTFSYGSSACIGSGIQLQQGVGGRGQGYRSTFPQNSQPNPNWLQQYRQPMVNVQQLSQPYYVSPQHVPKASQRWNQQQYARPSTPQGYHASVPPNANCQYNPASQNVPRMCSNTPYVPFDERMKKPRRPVGSKLVSAKETGTLK